MSALAVVTAKLPPSSMAAAVKIIRCIFCPLSLLPRLAQGEPCGFETYHFVESNHTIFHKKLNSLFVIVFILFPLSRMFLFHSQHLSIFMIKVSAAALHSSNVASAPLFPLAIALRLQGRVRRWRQCLDRLIVYIEEQHFRAALGQ